MHRAAPSTKCTIRDGRIGACHQSVYWDFASASNLTALLKIPPPPHFPRARFDEWVTTDRLLPATPANEELAKKLLLDRKESLKKPAAAAESASSEKAGSSDEDEDESDGDAKPKRSRKRHSSGRSGKDGRRGAKRRGRADVSRFFFSVYHCPTHVVAFCDMFAWSFFFRKI